VTFRRLSERSPSRPVSPRHDAVRGSVPRDGVPWRETLRERPVTHLSETARCGTDFDVRFAGAGGRPKLG
jgi:hypothetical protein